MTVPDPTYRSLASNSNWNVEIPTSIVILGCCDVNLNRISTAVLSAAHRPPSSSIWHAWSWLLFARLHHQRDLILLLFFFLSFWRYREQLAVGRRLTSSSRVLRASARSYHPSRRRLRLGLGGVGSVSIDSEYRAQSKRSSIKSRTYRGCRVRHASTSLWHGLFYPSSLVTIHHSLEKFQEIQWILIRSYLTNINLLRIKIFSVTNYFSCPQRPKKPEPLLSRCLNYAIN